MARILAVAAHPDDEVLGVGGTLARHAAAGDEVHILILAEGATSRGAVRDPQGRNAELDALARAAAAAAPALGAELPTLCGLPDNRLDTVALIDIVKRVEEAVARVTPDIVYTHHVGDLNVDHRIAHEAVLTACRPLPGSPVTAVYAFETPSSTEWAGSHATASFQPTRFVDIAESLDRKRAALDAYATELRPFPHPRSHEAIEALARWRGASAGVDAAEAFVVVREVVR